MRLNVAFPPRFTGEPVTVILLPLLRVIAFDATAPEVTVKFVKLKEATPFWVSVALAAVKVTVDPEPEVDIPCAAVPKIFKLFNAGVALPESSVNVKGTDPLPSIVIDPGPLVIVMPDPAVRVAKTGGEPTDPMGSWPFVATPSMVNGEEPLVTRRELAAGELRPVPPWLAGKGVALKKEVILEGVRATVVADCADAWRFVAYAVTPFCVVVESIPETVSVLVPGLPTILTPCVLSPNTNILNEPLGPTGPPELPSKVSVAGPIPIDVMSSLSVKGLN